MLANYPKEDERILMEIPGGIHVKDRKREWTKEREREREPTNHVVSISWPTKKTKHEL